MKHAPSAGALFALLHFVSILNAAALSYNTSNLQSSLQKCASSADIINFLGENKSFLSSSLASTVLVRLSKMSNEAIPVDAVYTASTIVASDVKYKMNDLVEALKAAAVLARFQSDKGCDTVAPLVNTLCEMDESLMGSLSSQQLSGIMWAFESYQSTFPDVVISSDAFMSIRQRFLDLHLPFRIRPGFLLKYVDKLPSVSDFIQEVDFKKEQVITSEGKIIEERRLTAWQGEEGVQGFAYSGKVMDTKPFSACVKRFRDVLAEHTGEYYDACLLNLYPDSNSAMRFHIDPDQGELWDYSTTVVSVGSSRRFSFREIFHDGDGSNGTLFDNPHNFAVSDGDITEMFGNCQFRWQHCVRPADIETSGPRVSLVFKRTWSNGEDKKDKESVATT